MSSLPLLHPTRASRVSRAGWRTAQAINLAVTVLLVVGLIAWPETALRVLWNVLIPLLPASFLVAPAVWRNICPLATLNMLSNGLAGRRKLPPTAVAAAGLLGIVLLALLVPARRFLLNENGPAMAAIVLAVAAVALVLGAFFDAKAGFCNAICPVLPVEKLYGQHPLVEVRNARCAGCTLCMPKGCLDLAPRRSALQALGDPRRAHGWLTTPFGIFAAALPGFIVGYYTTENAPLAAAATIYLYVAGWAGASYFTTFLLVRGLDLSAPRTLTYLAATAVSLYYWFAAPLIAATLQMTGTGTLFLRAAAFALVLFWIWRARGKPIEALNLLRHYRPDEAERTDLLLHPTREAR